MKFSLSKSVLQNAVSSSIKAVTNKSSLPALECLHLNANDGTLKISGYDLSLGIKSTIEADVLQSGTCLINAKLFSDILRKLPEDEITISVDDDFKVKIVCGRAIFDLIASDPCEFPEIPAVEKLNNLQIDSLVLKNIINETKFARSDNESKIVHTGFLFEVSGENLTVVAVDGYRLALRREKIEGSNIENATFIIPGLSLIELEKLLEGDMVSIHLDSKHILFEIGNIILTTRLLEGEFLDYKAAIPSDFESVITADIDNLRRSIDRVSLIISEKVRNPIRFSFEQNILKLSCITTLGKSYDEFLFDGEIDDLEIGFNNKYVIDALGACSHESANLSFKGALSPLVITPCDDSNSFLYLILPVRLKTND